MAASLAAPLREGEVAGRARAIWAVIWVAIWAVKRTPVMRAERCALAISAVACARAVVRMRQARRVLL